MARQARGHLLLLTTNQMYVGSSLQVLEDAGFSSVSVPTAEAALPLLQKGLVPSAIPLDLLMPGMGGL